jgi:hypothetical protein
MQNRHYVLIILLAVVGGYVLGKKTSFGLPVIG